ncbi:MAG TPA: hypothetical protein VMA75_02425 [Candidatus Paceibacterota bacterium]|nr:hypothetical protein [Candidatus Paceibacterota bacterium]
MNKTNKVIVVVVLVLVVLFGVGQFFAFGTPAAAPQNETSSTSTATAPAVPATQVIAYTAPEPASSTPVHSGSCWTDSIAAPFRADAWRCTVGNNISDPCFQIGGSTTTLLCNVNPTQTDSTSTFVLDLTKPLPTPEVPPTGSAPANWAWLVQLGDGTLCTPFTGTLPITTDGAANYGCAPGPLGTDVMLFGELNSSSSVWTAEAGTIGQPGSTSSLPSIATSSTVPVAAVWQ